MKQLKLSIVVILVLMTSVAVYLKLHTKISPFALYIRIYNSTISSAKAFAVDPRVKVTTCQNGTDSECSPWKEMSGYGQPGCQYGTDSECSPWREEMSGYGQPDSKRYLIYLCDKERACKGWADRQKGMTSAFMLAIVTDRRFGIVLTKPCNLLLFYRPNHVDWIVPESQLAGKSSVSIDDISPNISKRLGTIDFNREYPQDVVYLRTKSQFFLARLRKNPIYSQKLPIWAKTSYWNAFGMAWSLLMRPTERLQSQVERHLHAVQYADRVHPLVCCHVRTWIGVGERAHRSKDPLEDVEVVWRFMDPYVKNGSHLFVATDSYKVREQAIHRYGDKAFHTEGNITHVDLKTKDSAACDGFESAVLDQLMLTYCDLLISSSGFSEKAAYMRGRSDSLYFYGNRRITKIHL